MRTSDMLTVPQAAVVAGIDVRAVNDAIDRRVVPAELLADDDSRRVAAEGCVAMAFYFGTNALLTRDCRLEIIARVTPRLLANFPAASLPAQAASVRLARLLKAPLVVDDLDGALRVDLGPFAGRAKDAAAELEEAEAMVREDPTMSGLPCIRDTCIPVRDVAASVRAGMSMEEILEDFPDVSAREVRLAEIYATAHPPRGRPPRLAEIWPDARIAYSGKVPRKAAE